MVGTTIVRPSSGFGRRGGLGHVLVAVGHKGVVDGSRLLAAHGGMIGWIGGEWKVQVGNVDEKCDNRLPRGISDRSTGKL